MREKVLFQYLDLVQNHGSVFGPDWFAHVLNELSIPWMLDLIGTTIVPEGHCEISILVGVVQMTQILKLFRY